jgi:hypothetical protein
MKTMDILMKTMDILKAQQVPLPPPVVVVIINCPLILVVCDKDYHQED